MSRKHEWWQRGVIYQIYPRSFQDSDGDGIGDLGGILSRLEYLQWLGVDAIWLSPIYPSPMADFGYDISNYTDIEPLFGTLGDFDRLVAEAHHRGMKVVLDFVPNHTSSEHAWFRESRSSRTNPKRNWYIWRDPAPGGGPPNNWLSNFGGPAWEFDERTGQYYYHAFLRQQPDLNWRNPEVQEAMLGVLRFWLDRGVDGFRVDVIWHIVKDDQFRNNLPDPDFKPHHAPHRQLLATYNTDRPEVHDIIARMRGVLDEYEERMMVGEIYLPLERLVTYYGAQGTGVHLPFNFQLIELAWHARALADAIDRYEAILPSYGWPNWVLGNHDNSRIASRIGSAQARVAAMLLLTLRGTPTLYYGDEIAMHNVPIPPDRVQDPFEKNVPGLGIGPRSVAHADAVVRCPKCRLHQRIALAAHRRRPYDAQRRGRVSRCEIDSHLISPANSAPPRTAGPLDRRLHRHPDARRSFGLPPQLRARPGLSRGAELQQRASRVSKRRRPASRPRCALHASRPRG